MERDDLKRLLSSVAAGNLAPEDALEQLRDWPLANLDHARIDTQRALRRGFAEAIFCEGKSPTQVADIAEKMQSLAGVVLGTRATGEHYDAVLARVPSARFHAKGGLIQIGEPQTATGNIAVLAAGTSDLPVAEEAALVARAMGNVVQTHVDVGVAGLHRLISVLPELRDARVVIAVAGMEGALPGVVSGLIGVPVIGVPTSVGYGAHQHGMTPLLSMLTSCSPGLAVVNIDNGFGAAYLATMINQPPRNDD